MIVFWVSCPGPSPIWRHAKKMYLYFKERQSGRAGERWLSNWIPKPLWPNLLAHTCQSCQANLSLRKEEEDTANKKPELSFASQISEPGILIPPTWNPNLPPSSSVDNEHSGFALVSGAIDGRRDVKKNSAPVNFFLIIDLVVNISKQY